MTTDGKNAFKDDDAPRSSRLGRRVAAAAAVTAAATVAATVAATGRRLGGCKKWSPRCGSAIRQLPPLCV